MKSTGSLEEGERTCAGGRELGARVGTADDTGLRSRKTNRNSLRGQEWDRGAYNK